MSTRNVDLYLNLARPSDGSLLAGRRDLTRAEPPIFVDGERPNLRIQLLQPTGTDGEAPEVTELAVGDVLTFALKKKASSSTLLVSGTGFALVGAGTERRYEAIVNFNTNQLITALADEEVISAVAEIRIRNGDDTQSKRWQFRCTVRRRVDAGEGEPVDADPEYPAADAVALRVPANANYRIKAAGGETHFQLLNKTTGKFHTVWLDGAEGEEVLDWADGED